MTRTRSLAALGALALALAATLSACGGDDTSDLDPQTVIDQTFNNDQRVTSGDLSLKISGSASGDQAGSLEASIEGPFQGNSGDPGTLPQLDWTGSIGAEGAGRSFDLEGGLVLTEDNAFVEYGGNAYELGSDVFNQFRDAAEQASADQPQDEGLAFTQACEQSLEAQGATDTSACEVDFESWLGDVSNEGTEDVDGTEVTHISGTVDVETMLGDLVDLGTAVPQAAAQAPSPEQVQQVADAVTEASFDLYSGVDDSILRGLDFNLAIDPSAIPDAEAAGVDGIDLSLAMRLGAVNEPQTIEAPADAQPIGDLLGQFGVDAGALGDIGALGGGSAGAVPGTGGGGDANAYLDCIAQAATPQDIEACAASSY